MGSRHTMFFMDKEYPNIPMGGGSGGGGFESEVIFQNEGASAPSTITLSKSMNDYDAIVLSGYRNSMTAYWASNLYLKDDLTTGKVIVVDDDSFYAWYTITSDTTLTNAGANIVIDKVYGLKFGSGSGGGGSTATTDLIYDDGNVSNNIIQLTEDITNYDYIYVVTLFTDGKSYSGDLILVDNLINIFTYNAPNNVSYTLNTYSSYYMRLQMGADNTKLRCFESNSVLINKVYGIKL